MKALIRTNPFTKYLIHTNLFLYCYYSFINSFFSNSHHVFVNNFSLLMSLIKHSTGIRWMSKSFNSVIRQISHLRDFIFIFVVAVVAVNPHPWVRSQRSLGTAAMTGTGYGRDQHDKFTEVHLRVSVTIQTLDQLVHLALVLCCLHTPKQTCFNHHKTFSAI